MSSEAGGGGSGGDGKMAELIDGTSIAKQIRGEIKEQVEALVAEFGKSPCLAVVLVGSRKDSATYVRMKERACAEAGIGAKDVRLPEDVSEEEVVAAVRALNEDSDVHGILVQLPLPPHVNEERVLGAVDLEKDVDGFHPLNMGRLAMKGRAPLFAPCTPLGCMELLRRSKVEVAGANAVVLGRSNIVGVPTSLLLMRANATVTICHSRTRDLADVVRRADIVVAAVGSAAMVRGDWIKPGAVVIDVGINPVDDPSAKRGYRLVGDVAFEEARLVASKITPVPGGVGPMTIAMLLRNTVDSARRFFAAARRH